MSLKAASALPPASPPAFWANAVVAARAIANMQSAAISSVLAVILYIFVSFSWFPKRQYGCRKVRSPCSATLNHLFVRLILRVSPILRRAVQIVKEFNMGYSVANSRYSIRGHTEGLCEDSAAVSSSQSVLELLL